MINKIKQDWSIGKWVNVGFMKLKVVGVRPSKDGRPDIYSLEAEGEETIHRQYEFSPYNGISEYVITE